MIEIVEVTRDVNKVVEILVEGPQGPPVDESNLVHKSGTESVSGVKNFSTGIGAGMTNGGSAFIEARAGGGLQGLRVQGDSPTDIAFSAFASGDSQLRFLFRADGQLYWGNGASGADTVLYRISAGKLKTDTALETGGPLTASPLGTGQRPLASAAGVGAQMYDTTLGKPIWSDGSVWKDALGTVV